MATRIVLIDDHQLFREGLRLVLSGQEDLVVAGEASDSVEGVAVVAETQPCVAVLDVSMPGTDGIAVTRELCRTAPSTRVLILTMHAGVEYVAMALSAGARGYALKDQRSHEVVAAVRAVARGETYLAPKIPRSTLDALLRRPVRGAAPGPLGPLSPREREIFDLVVRGYTNENVAAVLSISVKTVQTHRAWINRKLGLHSTADLVRLAATHGLVGDWSALKV